MLEDLLQAFSQGQRRALARLLTLLAQGKCPREIIRRLPLPEQQSRVVALTGSAGVGKSTLTGKLLEVIRLKNQSVAVLACDPRSPLSGGSLLGDRFRMPANPEDEGVFIRSLSTPGGQSAILKQIPDMIHLLRAFGFEVILIETVGAGQGDTHVREFVDSLVLLLQPETGDDLQWEKAGVLEVADVIVIQKADLPRADLVEAQVKAMLALSDRPAPVVLSVSARTGRNVPELWEAIEQLPLRECRSNERELLDLTLELLTNRFDELHRSLSERIVSIQNRWQNDELTDLKAAREIAALLLNQETE